MPRKTHHVVTISDGGWDVKKGGSKRSIKHFDKKHDAVDFGRNVSKNQESELVIIRKTEPFRIQIAMVAIHAHQRIKNGSAKSVMPRLLRDCSHR